jgi:hypothetical protein
MRKCHLPPLNGNPPSIAGEYKRGEHSSITPAFSFLHDDTS